MRTDERVILVYQKLQADFLGERKTEVLSKSIPCLRDTMTLEEQMGVFGQYRIDGFKLYLEGFHDGFSEIIYRGKKRKIGGKKHLRRRTVIYI